MNNIRVGFIGLGNMGRPMVRHIAEAGFPVTVFDLDPAARAAVAAEAGITAVESVGDVGRVSDIVITMLPDGDIVRRVAAGPDGLTSTLRAGALVIDMSSSYPLVTRETGAALAEKNILFIDAPVSGGVRRAVTGDLAIMAGGEDAAVDAALPVLRTMGKIFRTGPLGSGHALKALNNFVSAAGLAAACEAVLVAQRFGIDGDTAIEVINASSGRNNATETKMRQFVLSGSFGSGFAADLMAKDLRAAARLAHELHVPAPALDHSTAFWDEAARALGAGADHTAIYAHLKNQQTEPAEAG